ncbi:MAG: type II secretion system F family protein [Candidatus ainarchaeum sp.]|nr:type II secretion system F family protein [Candidatus ainarchaeum sp.]
MTLPFNLFPVPMLRRFSQPLVPLAMKIKGIFPNLELQLQQARMEFQIREYLAMMLFLAGFYFIWLGALFTIVLTKVTPNFLLLGFTIAAIMALAVFIQFSMYPTMQIRKRQRELEKNLLFALRTLLIEIKSGVSLFDAMQMIAKSNYGELSKEFAKAVDEINTGTPYDEVFQKLATNNPSEYFRKALWQLVNGMKAGGDISSIIKETVKSAARDQRIAINMYSSQLRILSLAYMMIGVIAPALGLTFLIILGSFPAIKIDEMMFWALLIGITIMQFMYIGIIKSRRPTIMN